MAGVRVGQLSEDGRCVHKGRDGGAGNPDKPSATEPGAPSSDACAGCAGRHGSKVEALILLIKIESSGGMMREVESMQVEVFFESTVEGIRRDINHSHVIRANKKFVDDRSSKNLLGKR